MENPPSQAHPQKKPPFVSCGERYIGSDQRMPEARRRCHAANYHHALTAAVSLGKQNPVFVRGLRGLQFPFGRMRVIIFSRWNRQKRWLTFPLRRQKMFHSSVWLSGPGESDAHAKSQILHSLSKRANRHFLAATAYLVLPDQGLHVRPIILRCLCSPIKEYHRPPTCRAEPAA